jgi:sialidase-1
MNKSKITILAALLFLNVACNTKNTGSYGSVSQTVIWSRADTSYNNYRIPSLIVTQRATTLAFAEGRESGDSGDIDIVLKRSEDNGKTWSDPIVIWDDGGNTCGNPCPVIDQETGRIILFMTWNLGSDNEGDIFNKASKDTRKPFVCYSDDDGETWSEPTNLENSCKLSVWGWYATGPGVGIQLKSETYRNRLIIPCNNSYYDSVANNYVYGCHVLLSDDGGDSWRISELIAPKVNESQVVELSDGVLLMNMRSYHQKGCRALAYSYDGGETWSAIQHASQLSEPICQGSIIKYGHYDSSELYLFANPAVTFNRTHMSIQSSFNDCNDWSNSKLIYAGPSAYSCLTKLANGNIGLLFEGGQSDPYENIVFTSFSPDCLFAPGVLINSIDK